MYADNPQVAGCTTLQDSSKHTLSTERWCSMLPHCACCTLRVHVIPRNLEITCQHSNCWVGNFFTQQSRLLGTNPFYPAKILLGRYRPASPPPSSSSQRPAKDVFKNWLFRGRGRAVYCTAFEYCYMITEVGVFLFARATGGRMQLVSNACALRARLPSTRQRLKSSLQQAH